MTVSSELWNVFYWIKKQSTKKKKSQLVIKQDLCVLDPPHSIFLLCQQSHHQLYDSLTRKREHWIKSQKSWILSLQLIRQLTLAKQSTSMGLILLTWIKNTTDINIPGL